MGISGEMMTSVIREEILTTIASILPFDVTEREHLDFVKDWIASGAEIFRIAKPDKPNIHLVSYFIVIDPQTNELLLVDHKKAELWLPPGGHVELNEHPRETVKREVKEELGIDAEFMFEDPLFLTVTNTVGNVVCHTDVSLWYVLRGNREKHLKFDTDEFHQIQWFQQKEIPYERTDPHMKRFVDKAMKKLVTLNSYEASASDYTTNTSDLHPKEEAQKFITRLPSGAKIVDIGCGPGRDAKVFSSFCLEVIGVDFSAKMIELAKQNAPSCSFYVMDIEKLTFAPESFHGIWANCALLHVPKQNIPSVLDKMRMILKPKGVLYLSVKRSHINESFAADGRYGGLEKYWSFYEPDELVKLLNEAKFQIVDVDIANKSSDYHTHPIIKIFAEKQ
jgi:8-oxo-dGTP diphosphatase